VLAAFGQVHFALHPGAYEGLVTTGDALRVAFYAVLLAAVVVDSRNDVRALRTAHADLRRLRDAELASAAMEERARLAREVHDGLAQDLWYAKLKQGRLMQIAAEAGEARVLAVEVSEAIDSALAEARQAVMALRPQLEGGSLVDVIERYVVDFGDRFGVKAEFEGDRTPPTLSPRAQAEVLRILQEALNNVRKHADATAVRVRLIAKPGLVRLEVADNGRGFEPGQVGPDRFGLESMRERAALIGGRLAVDSTPHDGARISVELPVAEGAA
jgi:signal transduction histidine kinase